MAYGFNIGALIKSTINKTFSISLLLILCTNLKSLYNYLVKLGITAKKRLIINVICLY